MSKVALKPDVLAACGVGIEHHFIGDGEVYLKRAEIAAGVTLRKHSHPYTHASILASGEVCVDVGPKSTRYEGPATILVLAGEEHEIYAVTDAVWYCIHPTSDTDPESVDATILKE